ncbi:hypothetical protein AAC387_Pa01g2158 [Persea americana]
MSSINTTVNWSKYSANILFIKAMKKQEAMEVEENPRLGWDFWEPIRVILRRSISSDLDAMVPESSAVGRLDFVSEHRSWVVPPERTKVRALLPMRFIGLLDLPMRPYSRHERRSNMWRGTWKGVTRSIEMR